MSEFVHLHVHTQYSLLDGFSQIPKLVSRAKELNMPALGITDHGTMFGVIDFFKETTAQGVKPIIGVEAYMAHGKMNERNPQDRKSTHLLLLAENMTGYKNLLKIASASQLEGFYYYPRIDHDFLAAHSEGLIVTSGCMAAEVPRALLRENPEEARRKLDWYYEVFGPDNFFIELQSHDIPEIPKLNQDLMALGKRYQGRFVATNDVHYVDQEDARWQDIMLCVQTGSLVSDPKRMRMSDPSYYLKSGQEMAEMFQNVPEALSNTLAIAERCNVDLSTDGYILPEFEVPEEYTVKSYLRKLCDDGLRMRYGDHANDPEIIERLEYELGIIDQMGFNAYFLIVWDLCRYSRDEGIWYNARGSAAGSIVAYSLEISLIDPMEHNLIFERFLNPGRVSMPDIDLDFQDDKRYRLMEYCAQKYGEEKVASIITFGKLKAKAAVRDVGRVLDIPLSEVDRISKLIPSMPLNLKIADALDTVPDLKREYDTVEWVRNLLDTARAIEGSVRNAGTHAAGVVITDKPVVDYIPLHRPTSNSEDTPINAVTQFEMTIIDGLGLLKVDFLGLSTLTIMQRCCAMIKDRHDIDLNLHNIPLDDPEVYQMLGEGNTAGVFQLEGTGMTRWVKEMKPQNLSNVIAMVALYRPGPMEFIPSYIKRMHGEEEITYRHEQLESILKETYGITVYQEQIMFTAMKLGGYTASEADFLRKTVAKKKEKELLKNREKFVAGAMKNDVPKEAAEHIFEDWEAFARYGFPKGHAADYAVLSVETAYLKHYYPVEYMAALVSVYQSDSDKVAYYVADCQVQGIDVLPPDINRSFWDFSIEDNEDGSASIRFGLGAVKNVGHGPVDMILEGRQDGPFEDLTDLANRVDLRKVGKRAMESLIKVGALDSFGPRMAMLDVMERAISVSASKFQAEEIGQLTFFGNDTGLVQKIRLPNVDPNYNRREQLNWERELVGLYVSDHPLRETAQALEGVVTHYASQLPQLEDKTFVRVFGEVTKISKTITKKGDEMAFVRLEDVSGAHKLVIFPRTWKKEAPKLQYGRVVIAEGRVDNQKGSPSILVDEIKDQVSLDEAHIEALRNAMAINSQPQGGPRPGPTPAPVKQPPAAKSERAAPVSKSAVKATSQPQKAAGQEAPRSSGQVKDLPNDYIPPEPDLPPAYNIWSGDEQAVPAAPPKKPVEEKRRQNLSDRLLAEADKEYQVKKEARHTPAEPQKAPEPLAASKAPEPEVTTLPEPASPSEPPVQTVKPEPDSAPSQTPPPVEVEDATSEISTQEPPPILPPVSPPAEKPETRKPNNPQMVTIVLRSLGDKERDILRMRRIYGLLISEPGPDRFAFYVIEHNRGYRLEFPSDSTSLTKQIERKLEELLGPENVIIEPITIQ